MAPRAPSPAAPSASSCPASAAPTPSARGRRVDRRRRVQRRVRRTPGVPMGGAAGGAGGARRLRGPARRRNGPRDGCRAPVSVRVEGSEIFTFEASHPLGDLALEAYPGPISIGVGPRAPRGRGLQPAGRAALAHRAMGSRPGGPRGVPSSAGACAASPSFCGLARARTAATGRGARSSTAPPATCGRSTWRRARRPPARRPGGAFPGCVSQEGVLRPQRQPLGVDGRPHELRGRGLAHRRRAAPRVRPGLHRARHRRDRLRQRGRGLPLLPRRTLKLRTPAPPVTLPPAMPPTPRTPP